MFRIAGEAATGVVSADVYFPDLPPFDTNKENLAFIEAFRKAHNETPDKGAALGAAATGGVGERGQRHQEPRPQDGRRGDPRQDHRGHDLRRPAPSKPNGQARHKHTIFKVVDGKTGKLEALK